MRQHDPDSTGDGRLAKWMNDLGDLGRSSYRYVPESYAPPRSPQIHLGFRLAFESLTTHAFVGPLHRTLEKALSLLPDGADLRSCSMP